MSAPITLQQPRSMKRKAYQTGMACEEFDGRHNCRKSLPANEDEFSGTTAARDLKTDSNNPRQSLMNSNMATPMTCPITAFDEGDSLA